MSHRLDDVVAFHDREMSPEASAEFEAHLSACAECQADLRAAEAALGTFDALAGARPAPFDAEAAMARFRRGTALARGARSRRRVFLGAGLAIAAALLVALALEVARPPAPPPGGPIARPASRPAPHRFSAPARPPAARDGG